MRQIQPSSEFQLSFLNKLQRLFAEGDFTATYKFGLLMALADISVELEADENGELELSIQQIGHRFVSLYWRQSLPYSHAGSAENPKVLLQSRGTQAAVVTKIAQYIEKHGISKLSDAGESSAFRKLIGEVASIASQQPLKYLQNFGGGKDEFIFIRSRRGYIKLLRGVPFCLRRFYPLIQQLTRSHWIEHIKSNRLNSRLIGGTDDLEDFLFSSARSSLDAVKANLAKLDGMSCFYCNSKTVEADVDHYIPFSLYPRNLAQNFVIACPSCNRSKSASLGGLPHLERWLNRNENKRDQLHEIGMEVGMVSEHQTSINVGAWAYSNGEASGSAAWFSKGKYAPINAQYLACFTEDNSRTKM